MAIYYQVCPSYNDGICDDGGPNSASAKCECGTDDKDCGERSLDEIMLCVAWQPKTGLQLDAKASDCEAAAKLTASRCGWQATAGAVVLALPTLLFLLQLCAFASIISRSKRLHQRLAADRKGQQELGISLIESNLALLSSLGLQSIGDGGVAPDAACRPSWLAQALPSLELKARVVDFWADEPSNQLWKQLQTYLEYLGFETELTITSRQAKDACAYVAARAVVTMHGEADASWRSCDLSDAANATWIEQGNRLLTNPAMVPTGSQPVLQNLRTGVMLPAWHVQTLIRSFARLQAGLDVGGDFDAFDAAQCEWMPDVSSRDGAVASIVRELHAMATGAATVGGGGVRVDGGGVAFRLFVCNSHDSDSVSGSHWATIALSMSRKAGVELDPSPRPPSSTRSASG